MPRTAPRHTYGKSTRTRPRRALAELPQRPIRNCAQDESVFDEDDSIIKKLTEQLEAVDVQDDGPSSTESSVSEAATQASAEQQPEVVILDGDLGPAPPALVTDDSEKPLSFVIELESGHDDHSIPKTEVIEEASFEAPIPAAEAHASPRADTQAQPGLDDNLRVLSWHDVCPPDATITKIAEASFSEVYRIKNPRGTSIIKCIRVPSPLKPQTKAQVRSGLVDEEPHPATDVLGELRISEWLADIPGFVIYKERYVVEGKAPKPLLETHQAFHRKMKRQDPDRLQFYPSPSRYLDETRFLVVELGDAGVALEDFELTTTSQLWDIFFLVALALARAEDLVAFEHRDLHEGNLCIRRVSEPRVSDSPSEAGPRFGYSGLDITILDYGLSRAEEPLFVSSPDETVDTSTAGEIIALDLEKDLSIFTSTHAPQCKVYRQMRSFLLCGGTSRKCLPPSSHRVAYQAVKPIITDSEDPPLGAGTSATSIAWSVSAPYTNVLWLAYTYQYLVSHFGGDRREAAAWRRDTAELWRHLDPEAKKGTPVFGCAGDVVRFAVEAGWLGPEQVMGHVPGDGGMAAVVEGVSSLSLLMEREDSIVVSLDAEERCEEGQDGMRGLRRSGRTRTRAAAGTT